MLWFLSLNLYSQSFQSYCFPKSVNLNEASNFVKAILTSEDEMRKNSQLNCLEIKIEETRVDLVRKFLSSRYQTHTNFEVQPSLCDMEITEVTKSDKDTNTISIGKKNNIIQANDNNSGTSVSILKTLEGKWSSIEMNDSTTEIKCDKRGHNFEVEIRIGSENSFLSTSRFVRSNEKIDLGEIVQTLNDKNKTISSEKGIEYTKNEGNKTKKYYLVIR